MRPSLQTFLLLLLVGDGDDQDDGDGAGDDNNVMMILHLITNETNQSCYQGAVVEDLGGKLDDYR